jgi:hypothetical protein
MLPVRTSDVIFAPVSDQLSPGTAFFWELSQLNVAGLKVAKPDNSRGGVF